MDNGSRGCSLTGKVLVMRADQAVKRLGGVADLAALRQLTTRRSLRSAVGRGLVVRDARGRYSLPGVDEALKAANRLSGILGEDSAAQARGWKMKQPPPSPCVIVRRKRRHDGERTAGVRVRYVDLDAGDVDGLITGAVETVTRCAARMPFDEALAVADSALRSGEVTQEQLVRRALAEPQRYRSRCLTAAVSLLSARPCGPALVARRRSA